MIWWKGDAAFGCAIGAAACTVPSCAWWSFHLRFVRNRCKSGIAPLLLLPLSNYPNFSTPPSRARTSAYYTSLQCTRSRTHPTGTRFSPPIALASGADIPPQPYTRRASYRTASTQLAQPSGRRALVRRQSTIRLYAAVPPTQHTQRKRQTLWTTVT